MFWRRPLFLEGENYVMANFTCLGIGELRAMLDSGRCSSVEAVESLLAAIKAANPALNAYIDLDENAALADARAADAARAAGKTGRLLGVPLAVKDNLSVEGQSFRCASRMLDGYVAPYDATVIARAKAEGALLVGRTNMDELALGATSECSAFGATCNPWDTDRVAGGSSSGAAAAVAGNLAIAALGSDTGGSARVPASFCGCVGLKPSYGRVSRFGMAALASSMDQVATLTKNVWDAALLLGIMAGHDEHDAISLNEPVPDYAATLTSKTLDNLRIGLPREYFDGIDEDVATRVKEAVELCKSLGASIIDLSLPMTSIAPAVYLTLKCAEASSNFARFDGLRYGHQAKAASDLTALYDLSRGQGFGAEVKRCMLLGSFLLSSECYEPFYVKAQKIRTLIRQDFDRAFAKCDLLVAPAAPSTAPKAGERLSNLLRMHLGDALTVPASLAGLCSIALPCGLGATGLPVGLQLIGPQLAEARLLRAAFAFESAAGRPELKPPKLRQQEAQ